MALILDLRLPTPPFHTTIANPAGYGLRQDTDRPRQALIRRGTARARAASLAECFASLETAIAGTPAHDLRRTRHAALACLALEAAAGSTSHKGRAPKAKGERCLAGEAPSTLDRARADCNQRSSTARERRKPACCAFLGTGGIG